MIVFHYTHLKAGISILQDTFLEVPEVLNNNLKPAIWFSKQNKYEPSVLKNNNSFEDQLKTIGCMRFVYDDTKELISWEEYKNMLGLDRMKIENIESNYYENGYMPTDWFCSLNNISLKQLESIEVYTDKWDWAVEDNIQIAIKNARSIN